MDTPELSIGETTPDQLVERWYAEEGAALQRYVRSLVRDTDEAADICQEAFVRLLVVARSGRLPDAPGAWVHRVAHNLVVSNARRRKTGERALERLADQDVARSTTRSRSSAASATAILPRRCRRSPTTTGRRCSSRLRATGRGRSASASDGPSRPPGRCSAGRAGGSGSDCSRLSRPDPQTITMALVRPPMIPATVATDATVVATRG